MRMLPCGAEAVLVEFDHLHDVQACYAALANDPPVGVTDLVPAARTVLVAVDPSRTTLSAVRAAVESAAVESAAVESAAVESAAVESAIRRRATLEQGQPATTEAPRRADQLVEVPVRYDGPDLSDVARLAGMSESEVVRRHTATEHRVAFCGFAPGFAYVAGLDPALRLPRRAEPRTRVPAGSVAIADEFSGIYPAPSPGGWNLIGTTDLRTFDLDRDPPFALPPGIRVRFVDVGDG